MSGELCPIHGRRPRTVSLAVALFVGLLLGALIDLILRKEDFFQGTVGPYRMGAVIFSWGVLLYLALMIAKGRNWARWILLVLFVSAVPGVLKSLSRVFHLHSPRDIVYVCMTVTNIIVMFLLFSRKAASWFHRNTRPPMKQGVSSGHPCSNARPPGERRLQSS